MQPLDDRVVLGVALPAAAGIDHRGDAQPVHLAHEVPGRVELVLERQLGPARQGRVEDQGRGRGDEQARGLAMRVALDPPARRVGRVPAEADRPAAPRG